jgi:hypothetical protein
MTSSQPVVTPNALIFTPDNKHCYTFSGQVINGDGETDTLLLFDTNSEYIVATFEIGFGGQRFNDDMLIQISFNDIVVVANIYNNTYEIGYDKRADLIIPPFTNVKAEVVKKSGTGDVPVFIWMHGKAYGMTDTGYQ